MDISKAIPLIVTLNPKSYSNLIFTVFVKTNQVNRTLKSRQFPFHLIPIIVKISPKVVFQPLNY